MGPLALAARGKGAGRLARRAAAIGTRYGFAPRRMQRCVDYVAAIARRHGSGATLPITAAAVRRNPDMIARYAEVIEFAVHGLYHVDHVGLREDELLEQLADARRVLQTHGASATGFRAPYLRWNASTLDAVRASGYHYDTSLAISLPLPEGTEASSYDRALTFYGAVPADDTPVLPSVENGILRIPYCLPDDEAVLDRLRLTPKAIAELWVSLLRRSHEREELLTLGVHPERVLRCAEGIEAVFDAARASRPSIWCGRLEDIAAWWHERDQVSVTAEQVRGGGFRVAVRGPKRMTMLARNLEVPGSQLWCGGYTRLPSGLRHLELQQRPFVGVHPSAPASTADLLRREGYVVEISEDHESYAYFVHGYKVGPRAETAVRADLETCSFPLLRIGRWPDGARSALALTGDLDALTIWDYAFRFLGR